MLQVQVLNQTGEKVSELTLNELVFGIEPNNQVIYEVVKAQRAAMRQGTHDVLNRSEVRGGGKKPWRQKGTGRARHGSRRSPIWRGGGVVFGPTPRAYNVKVNRKVVKLATKSVLSLHASKGQLIVVDKIEFEQPKTKLFQNTLNSINANGKTLYIDVNLADNVILAGRNIPTLKLETTAHTSVYDLMNCTQLVLTSEAVKYFEGVLLND